MDPGHRLRRDPTGNWLTFQQRKAIVHMYLLIEVMKYSATVCQKSFMSYIITICPSVRPGHMYVLPVHQGFVLSPIRVPEKVGVNHNGKDHHQSWFQLMHHNFTLLTKSLYMFRAPTCPSSGGQTIHTPQLVQFHLL